MSKVRISADLQLLKKHQDEKDYIKRNLLANAILSELPESLQRLQGRANFHTRLNYQLDIAEVCDRSRNDSGLIAVAFDLSDDWRRFQRKWKELSTTLAAVENDANLETSDAVKHVFRKYPKELRRLRDDSLNRNFGKMQLRVSVALGIETELLRLMQFMIEENKAYWEKVLSPELERFLSARNLS